MAQPRGEAAVDALFAEVLAAGENQGRARQLAARCVDENLLGAVLHRALPVAFLEAVAGVSPWSERPRLLARVVLNPRAPRALSQRLVGALYWRDLAEVAATPRIVAAVRSLPCSFLLQFSTAQRDALDTPRTRAIESPGCGPSGPRRREPWARSAKSFGENASCAA